MTKNKNKSKRLKTTDIVHIGLLAAIIAVCSWITVPFTVPFTLQTLGVCVAAGLLGAKRGTLCVAVYLLIGLIGVPVFSGFGAGAGVLLGTTGGYLIGFLFTALIVGAASDALGNKPWVYVVSMIAGEIVLYIFGTAWFIVVYNHGNAEPAGIAAALGWCVVPFIIPDLVKIGIAAFICTKLKKYIK